MTHDELQAIKARAEAATPGPWTPGAGKIAGESRELVIAPNDDVIVAIAYGGFGNPVDRTTQDRTFIAHARTDVPALVAEVERLHAENEQMRTVIAAEKESADKYVAAFDAEVDRRATAEAEVERLRALAASAATTIEALIRECGGADPEDRATLERLKTIRTEDEPQRIRNLREGSWDM